MHNRYVVLAAGVLIQTVLGGIYAWSTFTPYLIKSHALTKGQCGFLFGLTIAAFTLAMVVAGRVLTRWGPRITASLGAVLFMAGYLLASVSNGSFPLLLLSLGMVVGAGIGFGYVCPLSVGMQWFPKNKGLVTGIAVAGFGGGALLLSLVAELFLQGGMDVLVFFRWFGIVAGIALLVAASLLAAPSQPASTEAADVGVLAAIRSLPFGVMTLGMFAGTFAGLLIIGNLTPMMINAGLSQHQAVASVAVFAVGNGVGRLTWGHLFDRLGYRCIPISLGFFALLSLLLLFPLPSWALFLTMILIGFGFGANFVVYASAISDLFGVASFSRLYPVCFVAYGVAGIIGPGIGGYLADQTASYEAALWISIAVVASTGVLSFLSLCRFRAPVQNGTANGGVRHRYDQLANNILIQERNG